MARRTSSYSQNLGLKELIAMGIGGMIGGGIFSVLGLAIDIAGHAAPLSFALGSAIAFLSSYSYIKLALLFRSDGGSYTFLENAFPQFPNIAGITGWAVILGYVGTLALYAFTFGAYGADLLGMGGSNIMRGLLSVGVLVSLMIVNLQSVKTSGIVEDILVYAKVLILAFFAFIGLSEIDMTKISPLFNHGVESVFMGAALIFVAFEGFQLITNEICESAKPEKNIPHSIYLSIAITSILYIAIALIATTTLTTSELNEANEYALAVVAEPFIGQVGRVLIGIAALLATSSAINGTIFGASRMMSVMANEGRVPKKLSIVNKGELPRSSIIVLTTLGVLFTTLNSFETIVSFSSIVFLLVCSAVTLANFKLRKRSHSNPYIIFFSLALIGTTIALLLFYLFEHNPETLLWVVALIVMVSSLEVLYSKYFSRH